MDKDIWHTRILYNDDGAYQMTWKDYHRLEAKSFHAVEGKPVPSDGFDAWVETLRDHDGNQPFKRTGGPVNKDSIPS